MKARVFAYDNLLFECNAISTRLADQFGVANEHLTVLKGTSLVQDTHKQATMGFWDSNARSPKQVAQSTLVDSHQERTEERLACHIDATARQRHDLYSAWNVCVTKRFQGHGFK